ncbi:MAG: hypothetical protein F9K30_05955 [Dechloromonas sp.]|nr:MAG: hypothetical protein F9K30_05955 [Dechloromonas sp.]
MDEKLEKAQLMARFKLMVKRALSQSVDLERLSREPAYARERLAEIEEAAEDEDLLVMVLRLRDWCVPAGSEGVTAGESTAGATRPARSYTLGARSW